MSSQASSGYHSNFTGSSVSLDTHSVSGSDQIFLSILFTKIILTL